MLAVQPRESASLTWGAAIGIFFGAFAVSGIFAFQAMEKSITWVLDPLRPKSHITSDQLGRSKTVNIHHDHKHTKEYKHRKNCECCPGHYLIVNHCSSMNVMVQVSQFVSNSQLCH